MRINIRLFTIALLCCSAFLYAQGENGMGLVVDGDGWDYNIGNIYRIDVVNGQPKAPTATLGVGSFPRFSPDGNQFAYTSNGRVFIKTIEGGAVRDFLAGNDNLSWTNGGIWVSGSGKITKYNPTTGAVISTYTSNVVNRNYVSQNEQTGAGVNTSQWNPRIYNMKRSGYVDPIRPVGSDEAGCSACPSPDGTMITNNLVANTYGGISVPNHVSMRILDTLGNTVYFLRLQDCTPFNATAYRWNTQCWSGNSNEWILIPVGRGGDTPSDDMSPVIYNIKTKQYICLKDNSNTGRLWQPFDYYSGKVPGSTNPTLQLTPAGLTFAVDSGATNPPNQTVTASTPTGSLSGVNVSGQPSWVTVSPSATSGSSIAITNSVAIAGLKVGSYSDTITVSSSNGGSKTYTVALTVRKPSVTAVLTTCEISPPVFTVLTGATIGFVATCKDQSGAYMKNVTRTWTTSGGGTISTDGIYTAGTTVGGAYRVMVSATAGGVTLRDTAFIDVSTISATHRKIDCGANTPAVTGWERDDGLVTGGTDWTNPGIMSTAGVNAAAPADIYKSVRRGNPHSYSVANLRQGMYTVRLHLADAADSVRTMSYTVAGVNVVRDFSIAALAGGANRALALDFPADLRTTPTLGISAQGSGSSDVMEGGIEVLENLSTPISLTSFNNGTGASVGQVATITWYADTSKVTQVYLELSVDDGVEFAILTDVKKAAANWRNYQWTVPASVDINGQQVPTVSPTCRLRIRPYFAVTGAIPPVSLMPFAITKGNAVLQSASRLLTGPFVQAKKTRDGLVINAGSRGGHSILVTTITGSVVRRMAGSGVATYEVGAGSLGAGVYVVTMTAEGKVMRRGVLVE